MTRVNWILDKTKFLSLKEVTQLLETANHLAETALLYGYKTPVRDYFIVHLAVATGLRVSEIARLDCDDIHLGKKGGYLIVQNGKGSKKRLVKFNSRFRGHYEEYLGWKKSWQETVGQGCPLLASTHTGSYINNDTALLLHHMLHHRPGGEKSTGKIDV